MASFKYLGRTIAALLKEENPRGRFCNINCAGEVIFPAEKFTMRDCPDTEGELHHFFKGYETAIPAFYVRSLKNGMCYTSGEEVYTSEGQVILDHTTLRKTPPVRWRRFLKDVTHIRGKVAQLRQIGWENNYYHWLTECLESLYLIRKSGFRPDFYVIANALNFQKQWLSLLGIKEEQIIAADKFIQADELIVPDLLNNWYPVDFRKKLGYQKKWLPHWILELYKETVIPRTGVRKNKKNIFVSRQNAPYRRLLNENALRALLDKYDFTTVHTENLSVEKQLEIFVDAKTIVGVHGAGLTNAMFSDRGTPVLELNTQYYHDSSYRVLFSQTGHPYHYMIGETHDTSVPANEENVHIDPGKFESALRTITGR
ncbi:MAG: glycosyltransferase family 61 protein [Synergistaceae bacterium]|jgi:hypothetical protein|nr:glycosyltransferase family 61 protein [Synergistaceae bacterium]